MCLIILGHYALKGQVPLVTEIHSRLRDFFIMRLFANKLSFQTELSQSQSYYNLKLSQYIVKELYLTVPSRHLLIESEMCSKLLMKNPEKRH